MYEFACLMCVLCVGVVARTHEPTCTSKFDYDYKMLTKIVDLERQQEELKAALTKQQTAIDELQTKRSIINGTDCPDGWTAFQGSCYLSHHVAYNFQDAEDTCRGLGGRLVHIETSEENIFAKSFISALKADVHWIGLEDGVVEGLWKWHATDTVPTFTDWNPSEPNGAVGENCVRMAAAYNWIDCSCTGKHQPLCERPRH